MSPREFEMKKSFTVSAILITTVILTLIGFQNCGGNLKVARQNSNGISFEERLMSFAPEVVLPTPTGLHHDTSVNQLKWDRVPNDSRCVDGGKIKYDVDCTDDERDRIRYIYNYMTLVPEESPQYFQCKIRSSCGEIGTPQNPGGDLISNWTGIVDVNIPARSNQLPQATNISYNQSSRKLSWNYTGPSDSKSKLVCNWDAGVQGSAPDRCHFDLPGGFTIIKTVKGGLKSLTLPSPAPDYCAGYSPCTLYMEKFDSQGRYFFSTVDLTFAMVTFQGSGGGSGGGGSGSTTTTTLSGGGGGGGGGSEPEFTAKIIIDQNGKNKMEIRKRAHYTYNPSKSLGVDLIISGGEVSSCQYSDNRGFSSPCEAPHYYNYPPNTFENGYHGKIKIISTTGTVKTIEFWLDIP